MSRKWNPSNGGQLIDRKEESKRASEEQILSEEEAECEADYEMTMERMRDYEYRRYMAENSYFAMSDEASRTSLPLFADRDGLSKLLDLLGLNDDPELWYEEHKARFPQFYRDTEELKSESKSVIRARAKVRIKKGHKHHQVEVELEYDEGGAQLEHHPRRHDDDE